MDMIVLRQQALNQGRFGAEQGWAKGGTNPGEEKLRFGRQATEGVAGPSERDLNFL